MPPTLVGGIFLLHYGLLPFIVLYSNLSNNKLTITVNKMLPTAKCFRIALFWLALCCILVALSLPALAFQPEAVERQNAAISYDIFFEDNPAATISQVADSQFRPIFSPLKSTAIPYSVKTVWTRIVIPISQMYGWKNKGLFPFIAFGGDIKRPATLYYKENSTDTEWRTLQITSCHMPLPASMTSTTAQYYVRIEGHPNFWFFPEIVAKKKAMPFFPGPIFYWTLIGLMIGIAGVNFCLAIFTKAESCFWLCIYSILATAYYTQSISPSPTLGLNFSTAWGILLPGLALIILPHIGRNLFSDTSCPQSIDTQLWGLSLLGVIFAILPLIPGLGGTIHLLPLWPLLALLGIIPGAFAIISKTPGGKRFTAGCMLTGLGGVLALQPATGAEHAAILQLLPFAGVACGLLVLTPIALHGSKHSQPSANKQRAPQSPNASIENALVSNHSSPETIIQKISHDLESPLMTIERMSEELNNTLVSPDGQESLRTLQAATHVLQLQLNDLLDLNRADSNRLILKEQEFDLQRLIKDAYHIMLPHAEEKGLSLSWKMAPNLPLTFVGDPGRLIQILLNLLGNAIRFSDTGEISISLSALSTTSNNGQLLVKVRDQGRGIPLQNQYDVLDRFCQAPEQGSGKYCGSGLGLSVTCELVHLMGGVMCIESEPDTGTTMSFTVRLDPVRPRTGLNALEEKTFSPEAPHKPCEVIPTQADTEGEGDDLSQVLIVETRETPVEILPDLLNGFPLTIHEVDTLEMAHAVYKTLALDAIIVATDVPSEVEALVSSIKEVDEETDSPVVPVIAIATRTSHSTDLITAGASDILKSPVAKPELVAMLSQLGLLEMTSEITPELPDTQRTEDTADKTDSELFETEQAIAALSSMADELFPPQCGESKVELPPEAVTQPEDEAPSVSIKLPPSSDEDGQTIFDRIAQERRIEEAEVQVTNDNHTALSSFDEDTPQNEQKKPIDVPLKEAVSHFTLHTDEASHPAEVLDILLLPKIPKIISQMQETYEELCLQSEQESMSGILSAAEKLQQQAQKYALREVERTASCVERAAHARDNTAIQDLMVDLETVVIQTGKALRDVYRVRSALPNDFGET